MLQKNFANSLNVLSSFSLHRSNPPNSKSKMTGKKTDTSNSAKKAVKNVIKPSTKENGRINDTVLRRRRAQSIGRVEDETARETRFKASNPDNPLVLFLVRSQSRTRERSLLTTLLLAFRCHKIRDSLFSSSSNYTNYKGLLNLCFILLVSLVLF